MTDPIVGGLAVGAMTFLSSLSYIYGRMRTDGSGCNGHHWGEAYRPDDDGVGHPERARAGLPREVQRKPSEHLEAEVLTDCVVLRGKAIKKCQDCGERTVVDITVGSLDIEEFE